MERWDVGFSAVLLCIVLVQGGFFLDLLVFKQITFIFGYGIVLRLNDH